jgi:cytochrome c556
MRKLILAISTIALAATAASADPIADRKALMKERAQLVGSLAKMAKGEVPFDAAAAAEALDGLKATDARLDVATLFPAGSDTGDTTASPKIWEDMEGFAAAEMKFRSAVQEALDAKPQDVAALGKQVGDIGAACGGCHETFRIKK